MASVSNIRNRSTDQHPCCLCHSDRRRGERKRGEETDVIQYDSGLWSQSGFMQRLKDWRTRERKCRQADRESIRVQKPPGETAESNTEQLLIKINCRLNSTSVKWSDQYIQRCLFSLWGDIKCRSDHSCEVVATCQTAQKADSVRWHLHQSYWPPLTQSFCQSVLEQDTGTFPFIGSGQLLKWYKIAKFVPKKNTTMYF